MARYLNLQIPSACHENWQKMVPDQKGRYCQACQKSVIDFTAMTDVELISYFQTHTGSSCGRFTEGQLNRDIRIPRKPLPWLKYFFRYSLPAFLLTLKGNVQAQLTPVRMEVAPVKQKDSLDTLLASKQTISGFITEANGQPLVAATVRVKGTGRGTFTDSTGKYTLSNVDIPCRLQVSYVGYESREVEIDSNTIVSPINLHLSPAMMGEVILAGRVGGLIVVKAKRRKIAKASREHKQERKLYEIPPSILVYPNPAAPGGTINLQCAKLDNGTYRAELYSLSGQLMQSSTINYSNQEQQISLKLGQVQPGVYTLHLMHTSTGRHFNERILVK